MRIVILGLLFLVLATITPVGSEMGIMPGELAEIAKNENCAQLSDFYESKHGMINPPYVYGYLPGPKEKSAVFWCRNLTPGRPLYVLVFVFKQMEHELTKCPDRIEWENPPGGLSIYTDRRTTLDGFTYIDNPNRPVPPKVHLKYNGVLSENDGFEELFYCYKGKWIVKQLD
ncbi:MAG: hypothetical protein E6K58_13705 [Nitrospirae bacterium]|nr:MAG: hypothetical protein E6K58_13705 [Nitrospirota bacterium]